MSATILLPRIMRVGGGASEQLLDVMAQLELTHPLVVTAKFAIEAGHVGKILEPLSLAGVPYGVFSEVPPDPTTSAVEDGIAMLKQGNYDSIIAIGGGSAMDSAKAIAVCGLHGGEISEYKVPRQVDRPGLPVIAIPTTAGTGSEVTKVTIITDTHTDEKMLLMGMAFQPLATLVDYKLTLTKPFRLIADTGIDSLTHAIEAYVSRKANPFSDSMALSAMRSIYRNIRTACHHPEDTVAREAMMIGATQAGIAFSNASVALVHGMSRPVGAHFHVPHGLSNAMLLPVVTAYSLSAASKRYADCARAMQMVPETASDEQANAVLLQELQALNRDLEVPTPEAYGIDREQYMTLLPVMAKQALASGSPGNNPRIPSAEEIVALYLQVYS